MSTQIHLAHLTYVRVAPELQARCIRRAGMAVCKGGVRVQVHFASAATAGCAEISLFQRQR